jgi:uncharacterized protein
MPQTSIPRASGVDPASPYVFDVREVGRRAGALRAYARTAAVSQDLGLDLVRVPAGAELQLDLRLESVTEGVLVTGSVTAPIAGECGRCLDPVSDEIGVELCELFAYPDSATDETSSEDEVYRIDGDYLDVEPLVRDAVVLGLPWTPQCRPDCGGLCAHCGQRLDDLPDGHSHEQFDPRWAALAGFAATTDESTEE